MANRRYIDFPIASSVGDSDIILIWQSGANKQTTKATFLSGLPENLDELNDVAISGLTNGQILRYDSVTGKWENTDQGNLDLNDLNDVSIVSPSNGQVLVYNSSTSKWENSSGGYVPYTGAVTTVNLGAQTIQAGSFVKAGGTAAQFLKANGSVDSNVYGTGTVTSVALTMPTAFTVGGSPITTAGTLAVTGAGTVGQYIRGDGSLADFPESSGGGSSVSYYLNGSVAQGTIGGVAYKEINKVPIIGGGTDFTIAADGYIASFITDAGDPNLLEIPGGNWNFETYFSASSSGGTPTFYVELYKYNGTTFTLIASSSSTPEFIAFGTITTPYFSSLAVPTTTLALTDRLAVRYYVTHSGRTITLHTENNHLCQIITTFTTGLTALNGLTAQIQNFAVGTSGTDFAISSATATHTFNLPTASATNRGALSSADWTTFNSKQNALTNPVTGTGANGQVAYFTGTTTITSESNLFWDGNNDRLGIGTNTFGEKLSVYGVSGGDSFGFFSGGTGTTLAGIKMGNGGNTYGSLYFDNGSNDVTLFQQFTSGSLRFGTNSIVKMILTQNGRLLIGNAPPTESTFALDVNGTGQLSGSVTASSFIKSGGTSSQFLKADGSVDSTTYVSTSRTITINGTSQDLSADRTYNVGTVTSVTATAGTGISISGSPITSSGTLTITNTAPDQVVSLTASTGISISGTYPNFTITNTSPASGSGITGSGTSGRIAIFTGTNTIGNSNINAASSTIYNENPVAGQFAWSFQGSTTTGQSYGANVVAGTNSSDIGFKVMNSAATVDYFVVRGDGLVTLTGTLNGTSAFFTNRLNVTKVDETSIIVANYDGANRMEMSANGFNLVGGNPFYIKQSGGSAQFTITTGGKVGIGTSSVTTGKLVVKSGESNSTGIVLERGDNTDKLVNIFSETADGKIAIASGANTKIFLDSVGASYFTGGNVLIGTSTNGASKLRIVGLPTSAAGLSSGDVYNLSGVLMIA